jgi:cellulose synthase/poly-beta-1,6-N-acetylglucosamine synthase-like glycosyltransferase
VTDLEIPFEKDRHGHYRFFEILPGFLSWTLLFTPLILSYINVTAAVFFILLYLLIFFVRSLAYSTRAIAGYRLMKQHMKLDWNGLAADIEAGHVTATSITRPKWHMSNLKRLSARSHDIKPSELVHAVIIATVNESREVLEPTIQAVLDSDYDAKRIILVMAYEGRAGRESEERVEELLKLYGDRFQHAMAVKHPPNLPGEIVGKGGNITCAGRALKKYLSDKKLDPSRVIVTTLDADNRPDKRYFASLSYLYCVVPDPIRVSYQPLAMFTNNIWDAPTLMRIIATGNNLFYIVGTQRPHMSRNFSAHAQSMRALIDMDFWSVRTIVEDGHHFWRSYFYYDGNYRVYPLSIPIYQDAVLADGYLRTMRAQFIQLRRWTYGASDVAYIADKGFWHKNNAPKLDVLAKFLRLLESHVTWATGALLVFLAAFIPPLVHPQNLAANQLPLIVSRVQLFGIAGLLVSVYVCLVTLPPRPARHKRHRSLLMLAQWIFLPIITSIAYGCLAAFNSQTRLMFKRYLSRFDVTEHATVNAGGVRHSTKADPSKVIRRGKLGNVRWRRRRSD